MSLRSFHLFFISVCTALSLFLFFWGLWDFKTVGDSTGLGLCILGAVGVVFLVRYFQWFRKKYLKIIPGLLASLSVPAFLTSRSVEACAVCVSDPNSPLTKGAIAGVMVLAVIVVGVLVGIAYVGYSWVKRARSLSTSF